MAAIIQLNLFDDEAINPRCSVGVSYRQKFGLENPPKGTVLILKYMEGVKFYLHWKDCQDGEDIVQGWFGTASNAKNFAKQNGWLVLS